MADLKIISIGVPAPDFKIKNQNEKEVTLSEFKGKKVLLSFHPLAWTSVCRDQMLSLEKNYDIFEKFNTVPLGISVDSVPCKKAWAESMGLKHLQILADFWPHGTVAKLYENFIDKLGISGRANILVGKDGNVIWAKVYPIKELPNINEVIEAIKK
ncbi:MAG: redoxin domain-containing protein [bacterium]|nr:redoxin domain-containing protein [bacterium]